MIGSKSEYKTKHKMFISKQMIRSSDSEMAFINDCVDAEIKKLSSEKLVKTITYIPRDGAGGGDGDSGGEGPQHPVMPNVVDEQPALVHDRPLMQFQGALQRPLNPGSQAMVMQHPNPAPQRLSVLSL